MNTIEVISAVAASGLRGVRPVFPGEPLDEDAWSTLLDLVNRERLWGLLADAVASGRLPATPRQIERSEARHRLAMESVLELEAMAVQVSDDFADAGLPIRLLKGLAVAHLDEVDPSHRCFSDVDILVRGPDLPRAIEILERRGYRRDLPERRPHFDRRFGKEVTMSGSSGREVDVHRTLCVGSFGLMIDLDELWSTSDFVTLAGRSVPTLDADRRLVHACYAAVLGDPEPRLVLLRDIGLLVNGRADPSEVRRLARSWQGEEIVALGVRLAADRFDAAGWPMQEWADAHVPGRRDRRRLRAYRSQGGSNTRVLLSSVSAPIGLRRRLQLLRALVLPDARYRSARRGVGRPSEFWTGLRELLRR